MLKIGINRNSRLTKASRMVLCSLVLFFIVNFELQLTPKGIKAGNRELFAQHKIVAVVNNDAISQKDLDDFINYMRMQLIQQNPDQDVEKKIDALRPDILERLIEDRLIVQEAKRSEVKIDADRIKEKMTQMKQRYRSDREFQDSLAKQGMVEADMEARLRDQLYMYNIIEAKVKSKVRVKPEEVTDYYYKNIDTFTIPEQRDCEYLIFTDEAQAAEAARMLKTNPDLKEAAAKYSLKIESLSGRQNGELKKEIEDVVFKLKKDECSDVVKIGEKFYIFKLNAISLYKQQSLSEIQDSIYSLLQEKRMQEEMVKFIDEIKKKSYIKIF